MILIDNRAHRQYLHIEKLSITFGTNLKMWPITYIIIISHETEETEIIFDN